MDRKILSAALLVMSAVMTAGCAGDGPSSSGGTSSFDIIQEQVFNQNCLSGGCHNAQSRAGNMNLSPGAAFNELVGRLSDNLSARADGLLRVEPFDADASFLMVKLTNPTAEQGGPMPLNAPPLSADDIELVRAWIAEGAPRGDVTPSASDTPSPSATATAPTATSTATPTTAVASPTATATASQSVTVGVESPTPTETATPSATPSATATTNPNATLEHIQQTIFDGRCAVPSCHDSTSRMGDLVLVAGQSFQDLVVDATPFNTNARDAGLLRVDPGNPDDSFLVIKLEGPPIEFGFRMPMIGDPLTAQEIQLIRDWIAAGAEE